LPELAAVPVPVLVVQGTSDPFGMPPDGPGRQVVRVPGDHSLKSSAAELGPAVAEWLLKTVRTGTDRTGTDRTGTDRTGTSRSGAGGNSAD
jgi:hypothetical protein